MKWIRPTISLLGMLGITAGFFMGKINAEAYILAVGVTVTYWYKSRDAEKENSSGTPK